MTTATTRRSSAAAPVTEPDREHRAWLDLLTGAGAADVLAAGLAADGAELEGWSVRQVHARPGAEVTVAYDVRAARTAADGTRATAREHLFATSATDATFRRAHGRGPRARADAPAPLPPGVVRLDDGARVLHVWRHPHDPALPGLAAASTPTGVADRLTAVPAARRAAASGTVPPVGAEVAALETVTYRPLRRAVLRARTGATDAGGGADAVYVKVVRPSRVRDLVRRHDLFAEGCADPRGSGAPSTRRRGRPGPDAGDRLAAPRVLSWGADGVVLLSAVPGESLAARLAATPAPAQAAVLDPAQVLRTVGALPRAGLALPRRPAWADRLAHYAAAVAHVHGLDPARVDRLAGEVGAVVASRDPGPVVVTHGDLHAANLMLDPAAPAGRARVGAVLDVDTLGPGHLVDDLACAVAHLAVLPTLAPGTYDGVDALLERWLAAFDAAVDPALLRARAAAVVVSLAAGAEDAARAEAWLRVAEELAARADGV